MRTLVVVVAAVLAVALAGCSGGVTRPASDVTSASAVLHGVLVSDGDALAWDFEYRRQGAATWQPSRTRVLTRRAVRGARRHVNRRGALVRGRAAGPTWAVLPVSATIGGLAPATEYEARLCFHETTGTVDGQQGPACAAPVSFTTRPAAPASVTAPAVAGTPAVGQVLSASPGTWSGTPPIAYHLQWQDCAPTDTACLSIPGATDARYPVTARDVGHRLRVVVAATNAGGLGWASAAPTAVVPAPVTPAGLHVEGNTLVDGGQVVHLHGVNRSGTEYSCIHGYDIFDGPSDDASVAAIAAWHSNIVRVPINEDCWLGINGADPAFSGATYRTAIADYVDRLHRHGLYAELSLMWAAPGTYQATYQSGAPDADHSPALWASLAQTFKDDHQVILAPWGETVVDADCFLNGGVCEATYGPQDTPYRTAGMQQAVDVMRFAGYQGPIAIPGIDYANDLSQWLTHEPGDPLHQLVAEAHIYGGNTCDDTSTCLDAQYAPVAARVPLLFGETGETWDDSECGTSHIARLLGWADAHGAGYEAWAWDVWGTCGSLITGYDGTPAAGYGAWIKSHYAALP